MGWWEDFTEAVGDAADTVADVVEDVVETTGDVVADLVETVGNGVEDGLSFFGFPPTTWLGNVIAGVTNLAGAVIKGAFGIVGGVLGGVIRIVVGVVTLNGGLILKGLIDIGSSIGGAVVYILGTAVSLVQRVFFLQNFERPLNKKERDLVERVFMRSLSLHPIRLIEGWAGVFGVSGRPFTLGNTIYLQDRDVGTEPALLVHECVHAWQYQNEGARYTTDALGAQAVLADAYDWEAEIAAGRAEWVDFNNEAQAEFMEDLWLTGSMTVNGHTTTGGGAFFDLQRARASFGNGTAVFVFGGVDRTDLAHRAVEALRGRINPRWSHAF